VDGLVIVDKPTGWTSHDVVARMRRLAGTRRVGHAGTLDPMATGVLILGVEKATRLLGHLALTTKSYDAVVRLGQNTITDDAEGEITSTVDASHITDADIEKALLTMVGEIDQIPSAVSAIKVNGVRSYARVRAGEDVELKARRVTISKLEITSITRTEQFVDFTITVDCSSGTYIRAIARDLGALLGVGGHLTYLRRTAVGPYTLTQAHSLDELEKNLVLLPIADAARAAFPVRELTDDESARISHGGMIASVDQPGVVAAFAPDGTLMALLEDREGVSKPIAVLAAS
jgi:tRNA pseudouridine55 synthase